MFLPLPAWVVVVTVVVLGDLVTGTFWVTGGNI